MSVAAIVGVSPAVAQEAVRTLGDWHEFYMLAGTAAVTLVGLLFVAMSFNLEVLLHDRNAPLLAHARQTLMDFLYVLIVSLMFLAPNPSMRVLGAFLVAFSSTWILVSIVALWRAGRRAPDPHAAAEARTRRFLSAIAVVMMGLVGKGILFDHDFSNASLMVVAVSLLLANAARMSWHLLVEVGRLKLRRESEGPKR